MDVQGLSHRVVVQECDVPQFEVAYRYILVGEALPTHVLRPCVLSRRMIAEPIQVVDVHVVEVNVVDHPRCHLRALPERPIALIAGRSEVLPIEGRDESMVVELLHLVP